MKRLILGATFLFAVQAGAATTYFSCSVTEPSHKRGETVKVTVKFAVKNLEVWKGKGDLVSYPGTDEDYGAILVEPLRYGKEGYYTMMSNLNGQGGDLRIEGENLRLWGDGDGYQFTELVIWDADQDEETEFEGYARDYGPTHNGKTGFKQFIKCKRSNKKL